MNLKIVDMFGGIGGFRKGIEAVAQVDCEGYYEIDRTATGIYNYQFGESWRPTDVTRLAASDFPECDVFCAGFPCQPFSIAGKRKGTSDSRGSLFFEIVRFLETKRPHYFILENVKGLLSIERGQTFRNMLSVLWELGYGVEWMVVNSKSFVPQNRERVYIVGISGHECSRQIFPVREGIAISGAEEKSQCGSRTGIRREVCSTIDSRYDAARNNGETYIMTASRAESQGNRIYVPDGISPSLGMGRGMQSPIIAMPVITPGRKKKRQHGRWIKENGEPMYTLTSQDVHGIFDGKRVRRLTPSECERLQGFPDGWTAFSNVDGNVARVSDTRRYRAIGNAVTVPVVSWIFSLLANGI